MKINIKLCTQDDDDFPMEEINLWIPTRKKLNLKNKNEFLENQESKRSETTLEESTA